MIRKAIEGLAEDGLRFKSAPDKWSIHHILIHVTDVEVLSTSAEKSLGGAGTTSDFV